MISQKSLRERILFQYFIMIFFHLIVSIDIAGTSRNPSWSHALMVTRWSKRPPVCFRDRIG